MGTEYDVERDSSPGGTQPHSLPKRCVAEQGGDALGGSALGAQSTITQMGHSDSPGSGSIVRDVLFEKSPNGPELASHRTQFIKRLVEFADRHDLTIQLVY